MAEKVVDYRIVWAELRSDIEDKVRFLMESGWQPLGGVALDGKPNGVFYQAMVKKIKDT
jgi:hypothetical protein